MTGLRIKVLTRRELDEAAAADRPVFIRHVSGHWAVVNNKALEIGGVREDSPDPIGEAYGRDPSGRLNGILYEQAQGAATGHPSVFVGEGFRRAWGVLTETDEVSHPLWALR